MNKSTSSEEKPKRVVANRVVTPKRLYFVPDYGVSVQARSVKEAVSLAKKVKVGDGQ